MSFDFFSVMSLHLALGLGLQVVNMVERAVTLDLKIRQDKGLESDHIIEAMQQLNSHEDKNVVDQIEQLKSAAPHHHSNENGKVTDHSPEAVSSRRTIRDLRQQKTRLQLNPKHTPDRDLRSKQKKAVLELLAKEKGPFKK